MNQQLTGKRIFVTGGTGFVGSHLVERLVQDGNTVMTTHLDLDPRSYFYTQNLQNKASMAHVDLVDFESLKDAIAHFETTHIFHLAAEAIVTTSYRNPRRTYESNIMGTVNVLEAARQLDTVEGIVVASSDKAYGTKDDHFSKYVESDRLNGIHPYEASKSAADLICYSYFKTYGLPIVVSRFGNIYGEGDMNFSRIIPGIMESVACASQLEIRSDGSFYRDYLYVKDVVDGYIKLALSVEKHAGEAFNCGSHENVSVLELLDIAEKVLNQKINYTILNQAKNEIPFQSLDYVKIRKTLGWKPESSLTETIPHIYQWYVNYFNVV